MQKKRFAAMIAAAATASMLLAACGSATTSSGSQPIQIGVPVPLSGPYASAGQDIVDGAKLAAAKINSSGGVLGRKIEIVPQDDACDPQTGAQAAQKLLSDGVVAVAGGYCSSASLPELNVFHSNGDIPFVLDASTSPSLTEQGYNDVFRTIGRDDEQGPFAANFIANYLHAKTVVVMDDNTTYAHGLAMNTISALAKDGIKAIHQVITPNQSDYTSELTHIASLHPDVLYYTGYFTEAGLLLKQARSLNLKFTIMGGDATNDPTVIKTAGAAANGFIITTAPLAQFLGTAKSYVSAYQSKFGSAPGPYSVYEYDAVMVLAKAIQSAGSTDAKKINAALHKVKDYHGVTGTFSFNKIGDRTPAVYITLKIVNQQFTAYKELNSSGQWVNVP
ncbi:MAG: branched-chain amino acid ABC transporter substrate-binding protein [Thermaerobacter sp.]|nr:branched-chain amino acid ABC transporter substrate-binding protein [Thermaerobacter sp.]